MFILLTDQLEISQNHFKLRDLHQFIIIRIVSNEKNRNCQMNTEKHIKCLEKSSFKKCKNYRNKYIFSFVFFLVCLVVLFLEIIAKTIWNCIISFFDPLVRKRHACNVHKPYGYMPWVLEKTGSLSLIRWTVKNMSEWLLSYNKC